jgi:hypothetical protein
MKPPGLQISWGHFQRERVTLTVGAERQNKNKVKTHGERRRLKPTPSSKDVGQKPLHRRKTSAIKQ